MGSHLILAATGDPSGIESVAFWILAPLAVVAALGVVLVRSAVHSALLLAFVMLSLAVFYAALNAPFLAFVQVIVYTGAVMMLFLFVLMLVGVSSSDSLVETLKGQRIATGLFGAGVALMLIGLIGHASLPTSLPAMASNNNVTGIAYLLFSRYVLAFELTSALLITAAVGAMVLAHKERIVPRLTQRQQSEARFSAGGRPSPLPGPGVYATVNSVDTPALLPDGQVAEESVATAVSDMHLTTLPAPEPVGLGGEEAR